MEFFTVRIPILMGRQNIYIVGIMETYWKSGPPDDCAFLKIRARFTHSLLSFAVKELLSEKVLLSSHDLINDIICNPEHASWMLFSLQHEMDLRLCCSDWHQQLLANTGGLVMLGVRHCQRLGKEPLGPESPESSSLQMFSLHLCLPVMTASQMAL